MKLPTWRGKLPQWNGKKPSKDAWKASLRTRSFRVGGYSVAAAAIVVVIAVARGWRAILISRATRHN